MIRDMLKEPLPIRELHPGAADESWAWIKPFIDDQRIILISMRDNNEVPITSVSLRTRPKFKKGAMVILLKDGTYVYNKDDLMTDP